jgi:hypothetical protein
MKEQVLLKYLQNEIPVAELAADLKGAQRKTSYDVTSVYVDQMKTAGEFQVTSEHLLLLCNEAIDGKLAPEDLSTIAFTVFTSDFFTHDEDEKMETSSGKR